jgi:hypothetical protein
VGDQVSEIIPQDNEKGRFSNQKNGSVGGSPVGGATRADSIDSFELLFGGVDVS